MHNYIQLGYVLIIMEQHNYDKSLKSREINNT